MGLVVIVVVLVFLHGKKEKNESTGMSFDACTCKEMCMSCPWSHVSYLLSSFLMIYYLVKMQGERAERERERNQIFLSDVRRFNLSIIERHFFSSLLQLLYTLQYNTVVVTSFLCAGVCVCVCVRVYTHAQMQRQTGEEEKNARRVRRTYTQAYS